MNKIKNVLTSIKMLGKNGSVKINNQEYDEVEKVEIFINGKQVNFNNTRPINITVNGDVQYLMCGSGDVEVNGSTDSIESGSGDVVVNGSANTIKSGSGDVKTGSCNGNITTGSGDVTIKGGSVKDIRSGSGRINIC